MLRDTAYSLVATALRLLTGLVLFAVLAKAWGPERFGAFMYPFAVAGVLVRLVDYGFVLQLARDLGRSDARRRELVARALAAKLILVVPTTAVAAVLVTMLPWASGGPLLLALLLADAVAQSFAALLQVPLRAVGRFDAEARVTVIGNAALFALAAGVAWGGGGPVTGAAAFLVARTIHVAVAWRHAGRAVGGLTIARPSAAHVRTTLRAGLPFAAHATVGTLNMQMDTLVVQHYLGAAGVGMYQAGMRIVFGIALVADALNNVYLASLARAGGAPAEFDRLGTRMTRHLFTLGAAAFACALVGAEPIVALLFSADYAPLAQLLPAFGVLVFLRHVGTPYGTFLTLGDRQGARVAAVTLVCLASLALNVVLVPRYGLTGAIGASIAGHALLYAVYAAVSRIDRGSLLLDGRARLLAAAVALAIGVAATFDRASTEHRAALGVLLLGVTLAVGVTGTEWRTLVARGRRAA